MEKANITISLDVNKWNIVLNALSARSYAEVNDIINDIRSQAQTQIEIIQNSQQVQETTIPE